MCHARQRAYTIHIVRDSIQGKPIGFGRFSAESRVRLLEQLKSPFEGNAMHHGVEQDNFFV